MIRFFLFGILLFPGLTQSAVCDRTGLCHIERPVGGSMSATEPYFYRSVKKKNQVQSIVFFHGGPGAPSIDSENIPKRLSKNRNFILTDIRGAGRNAKGFEAESINTEMIAEDMVAVIRAENLENFVLYGGSFGTVIATMVAEKLEKIGIHPKAVVLEGTLGHAYQIEKSPTILDEAFRLWAQIKKDLPLTKANTFMDDKANLDLDNVQWGTAILNILFGQPWPTSINSLKSIFEATHDPKKTEALNLIIKKWSSGVPRAAFENEEPVAGEPNMTDMKCRELGMFPRVGPVVFFRGDLLALSWDEHRDGQYICEGRARTRPYDSANWQIRGPIYYFQGAFDPNTSVVQAQYHYERQETPNKFFALAKDAGHDVFSKALESCRESIWDDVFAGREPKVSSCKGEIKVSTVSK